MSHLFIWTHFEDITVDNREWHEYWHKAIVIALICLYPSKLQKPVSRNQEYTLLLLHNL